VIPLVQELAADHVPVAVTCRVLNLPRSSYYKALGGEPSSRAVADEQLTATITAVHTRTPAGPTAPPGSMPSCATAWACGVAANRWTG
jgi:putative transposase